MKLAGGKPAPLTKTETGTLQLEKMEVLGRSDGLSNKPLIQMDENGSLGMTVYDREELDRLGALSTEEIFRDLGEITSYGNTRQAQVTSPQGGGVNSYTSATLSVRGFAGGQVTVLVNGRRLAASTAPTTAGQAAADVSRIPASMIQRIEVLGSAASALYGGSSVGGVVNIVLKRSYHSRELGLHHRHLPRWRRGISFRVGLRGAHAE